MRIPNSMSAWVLASRCHRTGRVVSCRPDRSSRREWRMRQRVGDGLILSIGSCDGFKSQLPSLHKEISRPWLGKLLERLLVTMDGQERAVITYCCAVMIFVSLNESQRLLPTTHIGATLPSHRLAE